MIPRIRPARLEDGAVCIPLITEAGGELLGWAMGGKKAHAEALIERCWQTPGHPLGPSATQVMEVDGRVIGALVGDAVPGWLAAERRTPVPLSGLYETSELREITARLAAQHAARPSLRQDAWYLSSLGIIPSYRRRGLGRMWVAHCHTRARGAGSAGICMEVVATNVAALGLYTGTGFIEVHRWTPRGGPEVVRMWRPTGHLDSLSRTSMTS